MRRSPTRRRGFTLIELLVAAALSLVVMTVLSLAFQTGMQTLSQLKSVVGMAEQLRAAEGVMRRDLSAYHLEADQARPVRVSDGGGLKGYFAFIQGGMAQTTTGPVGAGPLAESASLATADSPQSFRTQSAALASQLFGRAWMDTISFTVRLNGDKPQEVFTAPAAGDPTNVNGTLLARLRNIDTRNNTRSATDLPPETQSADPTNTQLTSKWAEVTYLLMPSGGSARVFTSDEGNVTPLPLYTLHRRQRVLTERTITSTLPSDPAPFNTFVFGAADAQFARGIAMALSTVAGNPWKVLGPDGPEGVLTAANRLGGANDQLGLTGASAITAAPVAMQSDLLQRGYPIPATAAEGGSDVLLNNVVSMTVRPVFSHAVPQAVYDYIAANSLTNPTVLSPDGLSPTNGQFVSYTPRDMLFPGVVAGNGPNGYANASAFPRFFDTVGPGLSGTFTVNGNPVVAPITGFKLKAVEIKLRVYDSKNKTSRQTTLVQDL